MFEVEICVSGCISLPANSQAQADELVKQAIRNLADGKATNLAIVKEIESCIKAHMYAGDIAVK